VARAKGNQRLQSAEPGGLWHQPALMNLLADLLIVLAVAGLAWAALQALQRLPLFPLRELALTVAPRQVSALQLEHAARSAVVGNFFTVDLEAARETFEKLPWVRKAAVRRQWPDGLAVTLEEHEAVARWQQLGANGTEGALVNIHGEVFAAERPDNAPPLPLLAGPDGSAADLLHRHAEFSALLAGIGRRVDAVTLSPRHAWRLKLDDGVAIELGRDQERQPLDERLARFVAHYEKVKAGMATVRVADMRYPNGFVVSGSALAAQQRREAQERKS
jgi:cell division protein FtsQ